MTPEYLARMHAYTKKHVHNPQPGDHFTEMCGSVALIVERHDDIVMMRKTEIVNSEKQWNDPGKKRWGVPITMTIKQFVDFASYECRGERFYWLECWPPTWPAELLEGG